MNIIRYFTGGREVERSDQYPWGTDRVVMPIPIDFAHKLRQNNFNNELANSYKRFLGFKVYRLIPAYINFDLANETSQFALNTLVKNLPDVEVVSTKVMYMQLNQSRLQFIDSYINYIRWHTEGINVSGMISNLFPFFKGLTKNPLKLLSVIDTPELREFHKYINKLIDNIREINKRVDGGYSCIYVKSRRIFSKLFLDISADIRVEDFTVDEVIINSFGENYSSHYVIKPISIMSMYGMHANSIVINNHKKTIYFLDSNGIDECGRSIIDIELPNKYNDYKRFPVMTTEYCPRGMFQTISDNEFCQTWNLFNILLSILNNDTLRDINDINSIFTDVIDHVKPVCVYDDNMSDSIRLTLIILEFMFYIYHNQKDKIHHFIKNHEALKLDYSQLNAIRNKIYKHREKYEDPDFGKDNLEDIAIVEREQMKLIAEAQNKLVNGYEYNQDVDSYVLKEFRDDIPQFDKTATVQDYLESILDGFV